MPSTFPHDSHVSLLINSSAVHVSDLGIILAHTMRLVGLIFYSEEMTILNFLSEYVKFVACRKI